MSASTASPSTDDTDLEDAFFDDPNGASLRPVEVDLFEDLDRDAGFGVLTPELAARRARLRRIVFGIVAIASGVSVLVAIRLGMRTPPAPDTNSILAAQPVVPSVDVAALAPTPPPAASASFECASTGERGATGECPRRSKR
jgi:hypothetical protein